MLEHFLSAFALLMVFEGMLPFLSPDTWRQTLSKLMQQNDRNLRVIGFVSMMAGVILLYLVHG